MGGEGGHPLPLQMNPRDKPCAAPGPQCALWGETSMETKPSSFGLGEHKVPGGLRQAVLAVLPQAFQPGSFPGSCGLWCCCQHPGPCQGFGWGPGAGKGQRPRARSSGSAQVDGCGMCCPSQGYRLLLPTGAKPAPSAGAGGWGDTTGSEGQAAHLQVPSFFSCLLCNVELWTLLFRGGREEPCPYSVLGNWALSQCPWPQLTGKDTYLLLWTLNLPFRLFLSVSHPSSFLLGHQAQFYCKHILLDSCVFPCCPLLLSCLPECCYCT